MTASILNPRDPIEVQNRKLLSIAEALMNRVENATDASGEGFAYFQTSVELGEQVRDRTRDLQNALEHLNRVNAELSTTKAEAEEARSHLSNALEAVHEGFALFDAGGRMVMRNSRFCAFLPDVSSAMEPPISYEAYAAKVTTSAFLAMDDAPARERFLSRRLKAHKRRHVNFTVELTNDRWVQVSEQQTPDGGTAILQTDITDMVRLEREERDKLLDSQTTMIRATLDHLNQGVAIFDAQNLLVGSNRRLQQLLSPPIQLMRPGTSFDTIAAYFSQQSLFETPSPEGPISTWLKQKSRAPLSLRAFAISGPVFDIFCQDMPDRGFVLSLTDITKETEAERALKQLNETLEQRVLSRTQELRSARDAAERANETRTRFVAAVSHDLLQPLNAAKLFLAGVKGGEIPLAEATKLNRAQNALGSVETILGALLDITRLDTAEPGIDRGALPLEPVLRSLDSEYRPLAQAKDIAFGVEMLAVTIDSDQTYFRRILQNLIGNAIRYTDRGTVRVRVRQEGDEVVFEIADTGRGIPAEKQAEVFREFVRGPGNTEGDPGMGLGLAIVERACRLLGHPLSVESTPGVGTRFTLRVPLSRGAVSVVRGDARADGAANPLEGLAALIVENDSETSAALAQLLEGWGMLTFEVTSQAEASAMLEEVELTPDMILSDFHLGHAPSGLETLAHFKTRFGEMPSVLITADRTPEVAFEARSLGVELVYKPVAPVDLRTCLEGLVKVRRP